MAKIEIDWDERNKRMENGKAIKFASSTDRRRVMHAKKKTKEISPFETGFVISNLSIQQRSDNIIDTNS